MLDSFLQSTYCLLPADSFYWTQWKWYKPVSGSNIAEKEWAITPYEEYVIFSIFSWMVKQTHKESKQITQGHTKNSTKILNHRTRYILVVTKIYVTACHTSSFKLKIYHLLRTLARWQQIYHGAVNNLLILTVKCRNTRSLKIHWSFRNHKFCWLFLTYHWVIGLLQLFHSHLLQLNSFILHVYLETDNQAFEVAEITHGYTDEQRPFLAPWLRRVTSGRVNFKVCTETPGQTQLDFQNLHRHSWNNISVHLETWSAGLFWAEKKAKRSKRRPFLLHPKPNHVHLFTESAKRVA